MTRQSLAQLRVSPLRLQQGLFASLALIVTLIGGQQLHRWEDSRQPVSQIERPMTQQTHFRAAGNAAVAGTPTFIVVDQAVTTGDLPYQERWVF